jgi:triosephosphate isomerase
MKTRYLFGNWKMYLDYQESVDLAKKISTTLSAVPQDTKIAVFPSAIAFHRVAEVLSSTTIAVGAQNTCWVEKGAYTGEVSAHTYRELGATYTLIGHSERRHIFHETNHEVRQKLESALSVGLTPVVCVGETLQERREGKVDETIEAQLRSAMSELVVPANSSIIVAYEPIWAINTGEACDPAEAERVHALIKRLVAGLVDGLTVSVLYGGSVDTHNIAKFLAEESVDGVLVGGASVKNDVWLDLVNQTVKC